MATTSNTLYAGIKGNVLALDRTTGAELWRTPLKGGDFVNLTLDGDRLIATTKGEIFCLDPATGQIGWHADLPGMGQGLISIATALSPHPAALSAGEVKRAANESAAVTAAVVAGTVSGS